MSNLFTKLKPYLQIKGLLIAVLYLTLAVFFVFFVPKTVPEKTDLETIRVSEDALDLAYNKSADTSYFTGTYDGAEMKSVTLTFKSGLELYGTNEVFLQIKERPEYYELKIFKDKTLFGERYSIYQIADEKKVLLRYDFSAQIKQSEKNKFFIAGLVILGFFGFILIRTLVKKVKS